jgi:hypothetical protein
MLTRPTFIESYSNLAILFGFITCFTAIYPFAPFIAFVIMNVFLYFDIYGLSTIYRRIAEYPADGIGIWKDILLA